MKNNQAVQEIIKGYHEFHDSFPLLGEEKPGKKYLTRVNILESYKNTRNIVDSPLAVFDLLIVQIQKEHMALILHWNFSQELDHTMIKQIRVINHKIIIYPYNPGEKLRDGFKLYEFTHLNSEQIITYIKPEDEIITAVSADLEKNLLGYMSCRVGIESNGDKFLEIPLVDEAGEVPIDASIISKQMLKKKLNY